ncbi:hypothetical protein C0J52_06400, partial [Blattella germanica]
HKRRYRNEFNSRVAPTAKTILPITRKLNEKETVYNLHKGNSGRRRTARTQQNIEAVQMSVNQSSKKDTEDVRHKSAPCSSSNRINARQNLTFSHYHHTPYNVVNKIGVNSQHDHKKGRELFPCEKAYQNLKITNVKQTGNAKVAETNTCKTAFFLQLATLMFEGVLVLHYNMHPHTNSILDVIRRMRLQVSQHLPYIPDFVPLDYHVFGLLMLRLKTYIHGYRHIQKSFIHME